MGATIVLTTETPADYVRRILRGWTSSVVRLEQHGHAFYVALRLERENEDSRRFGVPIGHVGAVVILAESSGAAITERVIGEEEGPAYDGASLAFLRALSPLPPGPEWLHARRWRERCVAERVAGIPGARKIPHA